MIINIQHEETGRLQEWPVDAPIPYGWARVSEPFKADLQFNHNLLKNIEALTKPKYHSLNEHSGRNDRLLHAVLCAYAKHHLDCEDIGWNQLGDILHSAICNEIGDNNYCEWSDRIKKD